MLFDTTVRRDLFHVVTGLPLGIDRLGKRILPFSGGPIDQVIPAIDMKLQVQHGLQFVKIAKQFLGWRAGITAWGGKQIHNDGHGRVVSERVCGDGSAAARAAKFSGRMCFMREI